MNTQEIDQLPVQTDRTKNDRSVHWPSIAQFSFSILAIIGSWIFGLGFLILGVSDIINLGPSYAVVGSFLSAIGALFTGVLVLPSAFYSLLRIIGKPVEKNLFSRWWGYLIVGLPAVILIGYLVSSQIWLTITILPWMHVLAIGLPVVFLFYIVQRKLPMSSPQTNSGSLAIGLIAGPLLILFIEIIMVVIVFVLLGLYVQQDPGLMVDVTALSQQFSQGMNSLEGITERVGRLLSDPVLMTSVFALGALIIPLIEELLKPIAVWLLLGRDLSPSDGFVLGVVSGAGYAIFENLALSSNSGPDWMIVILARTGTTVLHMATSGLVGWGIVMTFRHKKYLYFPIMYLLAVVMHSLWNGSVISDTVVNFLSAEDIPAVIQQIAGTTEFIIIGLSILSLLIMFSMNILLRRAIMSPASDGSKSAPSVMD